MKTQVPHELVLVLGGARSGKSSWALRYVEEHYSSYLFLATAEVGDEEMADRVRLHRLARGPKWRALEEPLDLADALENRTQGAEAVLIDCLTLWLSNVLLKNGEEAVQGAQERLLEALSKRKQAIVAVSNEVGLGVVPAYPLGRQFRDLAGVLNQRVAAVADKVVFAVAGLPMALKGSV